MTRDSCPIWGTPATVREIFETGSYRVDSPRAGGLYVVSRDARDDYLVPRSRLDDQAKTRLTTWLIDQHCLGVECPEITSNTLDDVKHRRPLNVQDRADRLLKNIQTRIPTIGDTIRVPLAGNDDGMLAWSESLKMSEVTYLLDCLETARFIETSRFQTLAEKEYAITPSGHVHLSDLEATTVDSEQAFIAMWFDPSLTDAYEKSIAPAIRDAGYEPLRIDRKDHNSKIDDEIIAEIRRSRFVVADFTQGASGARGGVYYEAGFAHGLNIPVIFTCRADALKDVHFDTRQYNHIAWNDIDELRSLLAKRISATLGDGPRKKKV